MYGDKYGEFICTGAERVHKTYTPYAALLYGRLIC